MHRGWHIVVLVVEFLYLMSIRLQDVEAGSLIIEVWVLIRYEMWLCEAAKRARRRTRRGAERRLLRVEMVKRFIFRVVMMVI